MKNPGSTPPTTHNADKANMAASEKPSVSRASRAAGERGRPRKGMPNALMKQPAASAAARASSAPTAGTISFSPQWGNCGLTRIAWNISHSDTKPLSGGSAEIAPQPTRHATAVRGMRWIRPPMRSMLFSPVAVSTAPATKNSRLLKTAWLKTWSSAAVSASAAAHPMLLARNASANPRPTKMMPMFSTVL